jgi:uncharacterized transporter YbjL
MFTPGLPSGALSGDTGTPSIPASAGDIIIEEAKPVALVAATFAQYSFSAVIKILPTIIGKASAKVSSISTDPTILHSPL